MCDWRGGVGGCTGLGIRAVGSNATAMMHVYVRHLQRCHY